MGGTVSGSVSMIDPTKNSGDSSVSCRSAPASETPIATLATQVAASAATRNAPTISSCRILRVMRKPPMSVTGAKTLEPIHQLAVSPSAKAVMTTAIAARLKICLFHSPSTNFDDIARMAAQPRNCQSLAVLAGSMMSARISAVIVADSTLVGTVNTQASNVFAAQHMMSRNPVEKSSSSGENAS